MIVWHNVQYIGIRRILALFLSEYYRANGEVNKGCHMSKVLHCKCSFPPIDNYIKHKLCEPQYLVTSFSIVDMILQFTLNIP
jgi:hypothetical protein